MKKNLCDLNHSSSIIIISYRNMNLQYKFENFLSNIKYFFTIDCNFRKISKNRSSFANFLRNNNIIFFKNSPTHSPSLRRYTFLSHLTTKSKISVRWIKKPVAATDNLQNLYCDIAYTRVFVHISCVAMLKT